MTVLFPGFLWNNLNNFLCSLPCNQLLSATKTVLGKLCWGHCHTATLSDEWAAFITFSQARNSLNQNWAILKLHPFLEVTHYFMREQSLPTQRSWSKQHHQKSHLSWWMCPFVWKYSLDSALDKKTFPFPAAVEAQTTLSGRDRGRTSLRLTGTKAAASHGSVKYLAAWSCVLGIPKHSSD